MGKNNRTGKSDITPGAAALPRESQLKKAIYESKLQEMRQTYWVHMTAARLVFKNQPDILINLKLDEKQNHSLFPFTQQAKFFYRKILQDDQLRESMEQYGVTKEDMDLAHLKLKDLESNKFWKKQYEDELNQGEYELQESFQRLKAWMEDFEKASREAFKDTPKHLVTLGFEKSVEDALERQKRDERRKWKNKHEERNDDK